MQFFSERRLKRDPKKSALRACGNGEPPPYQEKDTLHVAKKNIFGILATLKPANLRPKKICFHKICAH